jgi:hypothetical protein
VTPSDASSDDLSYDDLVYEEAPSSLRQVLTGLVVVLTAVLGAPQVWDALQRGDFGPELVFFPVLVVALGWLTVKGSEAR